MFMGKLSHVRENENWQFCFRHTLRVHRRAIKKCGRGREKRKGGRVGRGGEGGGWAVMVFRFSEIDPHKSDRIRNQGTKFPFPLSHLFYKHYIIVTYFFAALVVDLCVCLCAKL
jgi:hypothetical protein